MTVGFNAIDPSPFNERNLDPKAEEFIVDWSKDAPRDARLALVVHLERATARPDDAVMLREAVLYSDRKDPNPRAIYAIKYSR